MAGLVRNSLPDAHGPARPGRRRAGAGPRRPDHHHGKSMRSVGRAAGAVAASRRAGRQVAATLAAALIELPPGGDFGRQSINHVSVAAAYAGERGRRPTEATGSRRAGNTSGIQNPMISSVTSKSSQRRQRPRRLMEAGSELARASSEPASRHTTSLFVVMAALIVCCAGHCHCDTNGNNLFSGYGHSGAPHASGRKPLAAMPAASQPSSALTSRILTRAASRSDPSAAAARRRQMDELVRSMAESVERQHLGLAGKSAPLASAKPSKFDSFNPSGRREATSVARHDDFMRDILASHERKHQASAAAATAAMKDSPVRRPIKPLPVLSKADQELRQIMLMHEHGASKGRQTGQQQAAVLPTQAPRWPSGYKLLAELPKSLALKTSLAKIGAARKSSAGKTSLQAEAPISPSHPFSTTSTTAGPLFTPRASAKNHLMGSILGLGQMLVAHPSPPPVGRTSFGRHIGGAAASKHSSPKYSQPANEFKQSGARPSRGSDEATSGSSTVEQADWLDSADSVKQKVGSPKRNGWLVDGATQLAQSYFKDSFRDLLTFSQLPIFSDGPVSTAPSDLEPGGKKWLADKQAAEQMRGNRTSALEELLRYVYILGNVGVRRKRDPLKFLDGNSAGRPNSHKLFSSLAALTNSNRRPMLALLADKPLTSLMKLPPPRTTTKFNSFLSPAKKDHIKPRGVMWEMATDPTLAVTMFHLLERASVALPLGFLLMPFVHMVRHNPLGGINLGRILPARASHRSVDLEELVKHLDMDKILSRSMRSTHRNAPFG